MGMTIEDLDDHEGYAARRLPGGTLTSTWTQDTAAFDAYVGACNCGWTGSHQHPPTEAGRTAAEDQWEHAHARPLLAAATPARVTELVHNLREEMAELTDEHPLAGRTVAQRLTAWSEHVLQPTATTERHHRLDALGHRGRDRGLSVRRPWERTMLIDDHQPNASDNEPRSAPTPTRADQRLTISVEEAGRLLGISRGLAYELVNRGDIPSVRLGRRIVVPRRALDRLLALPDDAA
jgi:excisionase family DNA binding protein